MGEMCQNILFLNLNRMKDLLENKEKINLLEKYVAEIDSLAQEVREKTLMMIMTVSIKNQTLQLLRNIQRDFSFSKIRDDLKW